MLSYTTDIVQSTNAVTTTNVAYNTPGLRMGNITSPGEFGSLRDGSVIRGYEFLYAPILSDTVSTTTVGGGAQNVLRTLFATYKYFRVRRMTVALNRDYVIPTATASSVTSGNRSGNAGPEAIFHVCRWGGPFVSRTEVKDDTDYTEDDILMNSAYGQMQNVLTQNRRRMKYVRDMNRRNSLKFSFAPTVIVPDFRMAFQNGRSMVDPVGQPGYQPNTASGGEGNPTKFVPFKWRQTHWKAANGQTSVLAAGIQLWGLSGAFKIGSWFSADYYQWKFRSYLRLEFKGRVVNGSTFNYNSYPLYNNLSAFLPNQSYNLNNN